ncbi:MAG: zf-HC2 domain-containing protein, partial [Nitrospirae bacterium]|nr:zf-HC2 domain-containing protein [Nitrospirota bacterium]
MRLSHDEIKELLPEYIGGSIGNDLKSVLSNHLVECEECRDECAFLSQLTALEVNYPEPSFWTDLQMKVRQAA